MNLARKFALVIALAAPFAVPAVAHAQYGPTAPPPPQVETYGAAPYPGGVYIRGHYMWRGGAWVWAPGYWGRPPRPYARWVPGHYRRGPYGYYWVEGHWRYR